MAIIQHKPQFLTVKNTLPLSGQVEAGQGDHSGQSGSPQPGDLPESRYHLPQEWATFLQPFKWDWFATIVPNDFPHPETLDKLFSLFIHRLNRDIYGQHYWKDKRKGVFWAKATELQKRGAPHHHVLVGGIPDYVSRNQHYNFLRDRGAQFSEIEAYIPNNGAEYYLSKSSYAWKRGEIDCSKTLVYEQEGKRICGKYIHEDYCARYASLTKPDYNQFVW